MDMMEKGAREPITDPGIRPTCKRTNVNDEIWSLNTRNHAIDVKGFVRQTWLDSYVDVYSLHPVKFRDTTLGEDSPWYDLNWMDQTVLESAQIDKTLFDIIVKGKTLESQINEVFRNITFLSDAHSKRWRWRGPSEGFQTWSHIPRKLVISFLGGMCNARGREAITELMKILFTQPTEMVSNIGGRALRDPCVRSVNFYPEVEISTPRPESSPEKVLEEENLSRIRPKRRRLDSYASQSEVVEGKKKTFVPDLIVEKVGRVNTDSIELLVGSVKSGQFLTARDHSQLKYELLPILTRQTCAVGLVICSTEARLMHFSFRGFDVKLQTRSYQFDGEDAALKFMSMCSDTVHYARQTQLLGN